VSVVLTRLCVTRNVPAVPGSAPSDSLAIDTVALSLSARFTVAVSPKGSSVTSGSWAPRPLSVTTTVSVASTRLSFCTATLISAVVWPARIVTVPDKAV